MDRLLTTDEAAELLNKPAATLVQWRYRGVGVPYIRVMGAVRYRLRDVEAWLDENTVPTRAGP